MTSPRVLIVDLNNFARYPTIPIGYLCSVMRKAGAEVQIFSPLAIGVTGVVREPRARPWGLIDQSFRYFTAASASTLVKRARGAVATLAAPKLAKATDQVAAEFERRLLRDRPDVVLISTYLMYFPLCQKLAAICKRAAVPLVIGSSYFVERDVVKDWLAIEGVSALVGGEVEMYLPQIVDALIACEDISGFAGVWTPGRLDSGKAAPPLRELNAIPFPDYTDFPWERYPNKIIPIITGRGCRWGVCSFCSDVTTAAGRTYRSRSPENVLAEVEHQSKVHRANLFAFTDLKLNSNLDVWHALLSRMQSVVPGAQWIGAVHVGAKQPNGLSAEELRAARAAGMVRLTTGLESGSQRMLDSMVKGTDLRVTSQFVKDATAAGISVRTSMIVGYPGETARDVMLSAEFLESHQPFIDRVMLNRFQLMSGTRVQETLGAGTTALDRQAGLTQVTVNHRMGQVNHHYAPSDRAGYRRAVLRLLRAVHRINRRELNSAAKEFEGVM